MKKVLIIKHMLYFEEILSCFIIIETKNILLITKILNRICSIPDIYINNNFEQNNVINSIDKISNLSFINFFENKKIE